MSINYISPRIAFDERFYRKVDPLSEELSEGFVAPAGEKYGIYHFRANGSDPSSYVLLAWDYKGQEEDVFISTKGDVSITNQDFCHCNMIEGDGVKKLQIILINNSENQSPYIGGYVELVKYEE